MAVDDSWVSNSFAAEVPDDDDFRGLAYFILILSILILIHSYIINCRVKKRRTVRVLTDVIAIATLVQSVMYLICFNGASPRYAAYALDLVANAICGSVTQFCDNFMVFERYCYVYNAFGKESGQQVSTAHRIAVALYIFIFLYLTWLPFFTIFPWFIDCNSIEVVEWIIFLQAAIFPTMYIIFNFFYTGLMVHMICRVPHIRDKEDRIQKLRILSIKAIIHNLISSAAILIFGYYLIYGILIYNLLLMVALHFLFNCKFDRCCIHKNKIIDTDSNQDGGGTGGGTGGTYKKNNTPNIVNNNPNPMPTPLSVPKSIENIENNINQNDINQKMNNESRACIDVSKLV